MKRILITGKNSYIGTSVEHWLLKEPSKYKIDTLDMREQMWKETDFSKYDVVFHVSGIAHVSSDPKLKKLYYKINRDLTFETAMKAKSEGVRQFIFMSSIIVYGENISKEKVISTKTVPIPSNFYGDSKLQAEKEIKKLESNNFKVVIVRPPMIYGRESKGNYPKLANMAKRIPVFPDIENERSMLHIDNLCEFIKAIIDYDESGVFFPQNKEYVKTSELVKLVGEVHGNKVRMIKMFNPILRIMICRVRLINKIFGNLVYEKSMSDYNKIDYRVRDFQESIILTELESEQ